MKPPGVPGLKEYNCVLCTKRTKPKDRRFLHGVANKQLRTFLRNDFFIDCSQDDAICNKCRQRYYSSMTKSISSPPGPCSSSVDEYVPPTKLARKSTVMSPPSVSLLIPTLGGSHSQCVICKKRKVKLIVVPADATFEMFISKGVLFPSGTRCCPGHIDETGHFKKECFESMSDMDCATCPSLFSRTTLKDIIEKIRAIALKQGKLRLNFDHSGNLTEEDYTTLTGLSKSNFDDLCTYLQGGLRDTKVRSVRSCLGLFLTKLRTGMSNRILGAIFNISKSSVRKAVSSCRRVLAKEFVPMNLGFQHISRSDIINTHTRPLAQELFGNEVSPPAILVIDGTYIFIQKSDQFKFQRRCYSMHKHRPLVKPMVIVSTTGYFVSVLGPYLADSKNTDAKILNHILEKNVQDVRDWLEEGDVMVVDRGFRDSLSLLEDLGIKTHMPAFLQRGQRQHSVEEANTSRLITKVRWVVESANARIKLWKYLDNVLPNSQIPWIGDYVRIVCAICNKYMQPLSSGDKESDQLMAAKMIYLSKQKNFLMEKVENEGLDKRNVHYVKMDGACVASDFPILSEDDLRSLTLGVYQIRLAKSYMTEHTDKTGDYEIWIHSTDDHLLYAKVQSRHTSSKCHKLWITYEDGCVMSWYCRCKAGARVVGTCAHVAAVLWYLGYARHQSDIHEQTSHADHVMDAVIDDSDDSSSDNEPEE